MADNVIYAGRRFRDSANIEEFARELLKMNSGGKHPMLDVFAEERMVTDDVALHFYTFTRLDLAGARGFYTVVQKTDRGWSQVAMSDLFMAEDATMVYEIMDLAVVAEAKEAAGRAPVLQDLGLRLVANPRRNRRARRREAGPDNETQRVAEQEARAIVNEVSTAFKDLIDATGKDSKKIEQAVVYASSSKSFMQQKADEFAAVDVKLSIDGKGYSYTDLVYESILDEMPGAGGDRAQDFESFREEFNEKINDVLKLDLSDRSNKKNVKAILYL